MIKGRESVWHVSGLSAAAQHCMNTLVETFSDVANLTMKGVDNLSIAVCISVCYEHWLFNVSISIVLLSHIRYFTRCRVKNKQFKLIQFKVLLSFFLRRTRYATHSRLNRLRLDTRVSSQRGLGSGPGCTSSILLLVVRTSLLAEGFARMMPVHCIYHTCDDILLKNAAANTTETHEATKFLPHVPRARLPQYVRKQC